MSKERGNTQGNYVCEAVGNYQIGLKEIRVATVPACLDSSLVACSNLFHERKL